MKPAHFITSQRPVNRSAALVRKSAMPSFGGGACAMSHQRLDRYEGQVHPGEGSA